MAAKRKGPPPPPRGEIVRLFPERALAPTDMAAWAKDLARELPLESAAQGERQEALRASYERQQGAEQEAAAHQVLACVLARRVGAHLRLIEGEELDEWSKSLAPNGRVRDQDLEFAAGIPKQERLRLKDASRVSEKVFLGLCSRGRATKYRLASLGRAHRRAKGNPRATALRETLRWLKQVERAAERRAAQAQDSEDARAAFRELLEVLREQITVFELVSGGADARPELRGFR